MSYYAPEGKSCILGVIWEQMQQYWKDHPYQETARKPKVLDQMKQLSLKTLRKKGLIE